MNHLIGTAAGLLIGLVCVICAGRIFASTRYVCPACGRTFLAKWWKVFFAFHINDDIALRCPHCGSVEACYPSHDQREED